MAAKALIEGATSLIVGELIAQRYGYDKEYPDDADFVRRTLRDLLTDYLKTAVDAIKEELKEEA